MRFLSAYASLAALTASTAAFKVTSPSGSSYWVQFSTNTIAWVNEPNDPKTVTLQIVNANSTQLNGAFSIAEYLPASRESFTITNVTLVVADGYRVQMVDPLNNTIIYTTSDPFSVRPSGTAPAPVSGSTGTLGTNSTTNSTLSGTLSGTNSSTATNGRGGTTGFNNNGTAKSNATSSASAFQVPVLAGLLAAAGSAIRFALL